MSLLDACHADVRDSVLVDMELQGLQSGSSTTGHGPTFADHTREHHRWEVDRAKRLGKEMFAADQADINDGLCTDPTTESLKFGKLWQNLVDLKITGRTCLSEFMTNFFAK